MTKFQEPSLNYLIFLLIYIMQR